MNETISATEVEPDIEQDDDGHYADAVAFRNIFAELAVAKSVSGSSAPLQPPFIRMDLITRMLAGDDLEPSETILTLQSSHGDSNVTVGMLTDASPLGERGWLLPSGYEIFLERLEQHRVMLVEFPMDPTLDQTSIAFDCWAESHEHAIEQAENAYPGCKIV